MLYSLCVPPYKPRKLFFIFGQIIDMAAAVLISVRMGDIETGEVVWEDSLTEKLRKFDINANFTYRQKPVRMLPGYTVANMKLLVGLEYSPEFLAR